MVSLFHLVPSCWNAIWSFFVPIHFIWTRFVCSIREYRGNTYWYSGVTAWGWETEVSWYISYTLVSPKWRWVWSSKGWTRQRVWNSIVYRRSYSKPSQAKLAILRKPRFCICDYTCHQRERETAIPNDEFEGYALPDLPKSNEPTLKSVAKSIFTKNLTKQPWSPYVTHEERHRNRQCVMCCFWRIKGEVGNVITGMHGFFGRYSSR